jgi:hypothetical protein
VIVQEPIVQSPHPVGSGSLDGNDDSSHIDGQHAVEIFHAVVQYAAVDQLRLEGRRCRTKGEAAARQPSE